jgi:predicted NBD/HSP70 family sugar kinase
VANLCNLFNPEKVIVGGSLAGAGEILLDPIRAAVRRNTIPTAVEDVQIVAGVLGERSEVLGALALVMFEADGAAFRQPPPPRPKEVSHAP